MNTNDKTTRNTLIFILGAIYLLIAYRIVMAGSLSAAPVLVSTGIAQFQEPAIQIDDYRIAENRVHIGVRVTPDVQNYALTMQIPEGMSACPDGIEILYAHEIETYERIGEFTVHGKDIQYIPEDDDLITLCLTGDVQTMTIKFVNLGIQTNEGEIIMLKDQFLFVEPMTVQLAIVYK